MIKADLHCHSEYSDYPSTWMHKLYNSPESFTTVSELYDQCISRGMKLVTITDHDDIRGCLELVRLYPENTFISCEVTCYFPEDNCKVHVLVYDITEHQYEELMLIRRDIYRLREYLLTEQIAYSVAHATYDQDGKLNFTHIEKLLLLFDVFEVRNGGSSEQANTLLQNYLQAMSPQQFKEIANTHDIKPINANSWKKGLTGGSDDHCGLLLGTSYTTATAKNKTEFIEALKNKQTLAGGMHGTFQAYAFGVFKHLHDYQLHNNPAYNGTKSYVIFEQLFHGRRGNWRERFRKSRSINYLKHKSGDTHHALLQLIKEISEDKSNDFSDKIECLYKNATQLHDSLFVSLVHALTKNLASANLFSLFTNLSRVFPATAMLVPFLGSLQHQSVKPEIKNELHSALPDKPVKRCLWFTDTIDGLNGVSVTLKQIAYWANELDYELYMVTCVDPALVKQALPEKTINFIPIANQELPFYEDIELCFPSLLEVLARVVEAQPDKIIISTPGPLGLIGLIAARILQVHVEGVYHTDFANQIEHILGEANLASFVEKATTFIYQQFDKVYVPSNDYIHRLQEQGVDPNKMQILPRGIDTSKYRLMSKMDQYKMYSKLNLLNPDGFTLLVAGRVSADKNINLVCDVFESLSDKEKDVNLIIAGDGPDLESIKNRFAGNPRVLCAGRVSEYCMPAIYNFADLQLFPSRTDTFGMVVLEGQACGLPTVVSNMGGPKEIIRPGITGTIINTDLVSDWEAVVLEYMQRTDMSMLSQECSNHVTANFHWDNLLNIMLGEEFRSQLTGVYDHDLSENYSLQHIA